VRAADDPKALRRTWIATQVAARFSTRAAGALAARLWFTPWAVDNGERSRARHARWLEGAEPITFRHGGETLAGFVLGEGPVVLLVHGWGERAATLGALVRPLVEGGYRVVGVDLPAHGDSSGHRTNILDEAEAVAHVIEELGGVHGVVAHSMGGAVATYALAQGAEVDRLVLIAPAVRLENAFDVFVRMTRLPRRAEKGLRRYIERRFGTTVWRDFAVDRLARNLPIAPLIVHDRNDEQIAFADGLMLATQWPGSRFVETEGLGHIKVLGDERVIDEVIYWMEAVDDRAEAKIG
jgi:pimeloyl-ACP methyl ester carboxylesterase